MQTAPSGLGCACRPLSCLTVSGSLELQESGHLPSGALLLDPLVGTVCLPRILWPPGHVAGQGPGRLAGRHLGGLGLLEMFLSLRGDRWRQLGLSSESAIRGTRKATLAPSAHVTSMWPGHSSSWHHSTGISPQAATLPPCRGPVWGAARRGVSAVVVCEASVGTLAVFVVFWCLASKKNVKVLLSPSCGMV